MMKKTFSNDLTMTLASSLAVGAVAGTAGADIVTVIDPDLTVMTTNQVALKVFSPTLAFGTIGIFGQSYEPNAINMSFSTVFGNTFGVIQGNAVFPGTPPPADTPALMTNGNAAMNTLGTTVDITRSFNVPFSAPGGFGGPDLWFPAQLQTANPNDFDLFAYADGDFGYIGYADSTLNNFGYIQIQRDDLLTWHLVGYRYGTLGESILIENLVPTPSALAVLAVGGLFAGGRKRRMS